MNFLCALGENFSQSSGPENGEDATLILKYLVGPFAKNSNRRPCRGSRISPLELGQEQITIQKPAIARVLEEGIHVRDH